MKKITLIILLLSTCIFWAQPSNYYMNPNFGPDGSFSIDSPVNGIENRTIQASSSDPNFYIEWDSQFNEWYNTSINLNEEFVLTFEGLGGLNNTSVLNTAPAVNSFYTIQIEGLAYSDRNAVIMETSNAPITFDGTTPVSAIPTLYPGQDLSLTITLSGGKSAEEKAFIRYTDDGYSTSFVSEVTFTGANDSSGSGTIPGSFNTAGKSVSFYVYTTTVSATDSSNHDLIALSLANNSGSNYSYTVESSWTTSATDGNWNDSSSWLAGEVPIISQPVTVTNNLTVSTNIVAGNTTINSGGSLSIAEGNSLTVSGSLNNSGSVTLNSNSSTYSSILPGSVSGSGTTQYNRYINIVGSGVSGGNDLVSLPLIPTGGQSFDQFIALGSPANSTKLATNGSEYAFGPYDNASSIYTNYATTGTNVLLKGKGYRAATTLGETLTFSGNVETGNVSIDINNPGGGNQWNLIGNPYPCYLNSLLFLAANSGAINAIDPYAVAVYGYNDGNGPASGTIGNFTIVNSATNSGVNIAPGQGFFVAAANSTLTPIDFNSGASGTTDMRTTTGTNDFILSRNSAVSHNVGLGISTNSENYRTEFYFNNNSSQGLDPGYDASVFGTFAPEFSIYSHLVQDNIGRDMAIQSLAISDMDNVVVPIGINANQGEQLTISMQENTLETNIKIYLEDNATNTWTLLNTGDYVFTPSVDLSGTGRFFVHFTTGALSAEDTILGGLQIYADNTSRKVVIKGQLRDKTTAVIYDIQGRQVKKQDLNTGKTTHMVDVNNLSTGLYIVELRDYNQKRTQKVIIK